MTDFFVFVLAMFGISVGAFVVLSIARQVTEALKARAAGTHGADYRRLLEETNDAQRRVVEALDHAVAEISTLRTRAESMERLLQEVG